MNRTLATAFLCLLLAPTALAGMLEGWAAYERGDHTTALREWRALAERGDAKAQNIMGAMYDHGQVVSQDHSQAVQWYLAAAEQGHAGAQNSLGQLYAKGHGVPQNYTEAVRWFRGSAEQGFAIAQHNLGNRYVKGQGVPQDLVQAHKWFDIAATQGTKSALKNRDIITKAMKPVQIAEAQKLAREWWAKFEKREEKK